MEKGVPPGNRRGITRLAGVQREVPVDTQSYYFVKAVALQRITRESLSEDQRDMLNDLLAILTAKEREAFVIVRRSGYSFDEARELMNQKSRGAVQTLVARAERKLAFVVQKPPIDEGYNCSVKFKRPVQRVMF